MAASGQRGLAAVGDDDSHAVVLQERLQAVEVGIAGPSEARGGLELARLGPEDLEDRDRQRLGAHARRPRRVAGGEAMKAMSRGEGLPSAAGTPASAQSAPP
jgi:hypothetical protein